MARRTQEQWRQLIEEQQASGLNASAFCRDRQIDVKYFSLRKQQLKASIESGFIRAKLEDTSSAPLSLHYQCVELRFDNCSVEWLAQLIRKLTI